MSNKSVREALVASVTCSSPRVIRAIRYESTVPMATRPFVTWAQCCGSFSAIHSAFVPLKYGSRRRPVRSEMNASCPSLRRRSHNGAVRRSCHTIALRGEPIVSRSHRHHVSRWLVIPTATTAARSMLSSASLVAAIVADHTSPKSCSTRSSAGKCCSNSR